MIILPRGFQLCECPARCQCATPNNRPYQSYADSYRDVLRELRPKVVREWGPGFNTKIALNVGAEVYSTESKPEYLAPHCVNLVQLYVAVDSNAYVDAWVAADIYFVDGRRRVDCIRKVREDAPQLHTLVLHDAQRKRYWDALGQYQIVALDTESTAYATDDAQVMDYIQKALRVDSRWEGLSDWHLISVAGPKC